MADPENDAAMAGRSEDRDEAKLHPAGPHAKPELTNDEATPGAGALPETGDGDDRAGGTG